MLPPRKAADKVSSPKIASRSRLGRAVKHAIFVPFRQAALRLRRRKHREAGFVISLMRRQRMLPPREAADFVSSPKIASRSRLRRRKAGFVISL